VKSTTTKQDWELLSAYLDGELPQAAREACEQRLAQEPTLAANLQAMQALQQQLHDTLHAANTARPLPEPVQSLLDTTPVTINSEPHRLHRFTHGGARGFAVAASLVAAAALLLVPQWQQEPQSNSAALLSAALEKVPSSADGWEILPDGSRLRPVLSFPSQDGSWCREYLLHNPEKTVRGVACRNDGQWETRVATTQTIMHDAEGDAYRPASAADSDPIATFVETNASGDAAGAKREAGLIARSWQ